MYFKKINFAVVLYIVLLTCSIVYFVSFDKYLQRQEVSLDVGTRNLYKPMRILCFVVTYEANHKTKAQAVKETWSRRCDKLIFIGTKPDDDLGVTVINVTEGYNNLWARARETFKMLFDQYLNDYDWFFKADDDTYVIMENLRSMLSPYDPESPIAFGAITNLSWGLYLAGGPGYALSREALRRYGTRGYNDSSLCRSTFPTSGDDVHLGKCLLNLGVLFGNSLDDKGRNRMFQLRYEEMLKGNFPDWYQKIDSNHTRGKQYRNISDDAISFHYVAPIEMYEMEYFLYRLRVAEGPYPAPLPNDTRGIQ